uniref:RRM domain-containing protein n=1 Tax=Prasinoderma coloniale TaxID=156133 RepID=A0A7R9Y0D5_9VIRI
MDGGGKQQHPPQHVPPAKQAAHAPEAERRRLFVVCGKGARAAELAALFRQYGALAREPHVVVDKHSGAPRGCAYVHFRAPADAAAAAEALDGAQKTFADGIARTLKVVVAEPRDAGGGGGDDAGEVQQRQQKPTQQEAAQQPAAAAAAPQQHQQPQPEAAQHPDNIPPRSRVFAIVPRDADEAALCEAFRSAGGAQLQGVTLVRDKNTGESKGAAYAKFATAAAAAALIEQTMETNGGQVGQFKVTLKLAEPRAAKSVSSTGGNANGNGAHGAQSSGGNSTARGHRTRRGKRAHHPSMSRSVESGATGAAPASRRRTESSSDTATSAARHAHSQHAQQAQQAQQQEVISGMDIHRSVVAALGDSFAQVMGVRDTAGSPSTSDTSRAHSLPPAAMAAIASQLLRNAGMTSAAAVAAAAAAEAATVDFHQASAEAQRQQVHMQAYANLQAYAQARQAQETQMPFFPAQTFKAQPCAYVNPGQHVPHRATPPGGATLPQACSAALVEHSPRGDETHEAPRTQEVDRDDVVDAQVSGDSASTAVAAGERQQGVEAVMVARGSGRPTQESASGGADTQQPPVDERRLFVTWSNALPVAGGESALRAAFECFGTLESFRVGRKGGGGNGSAGGSSTFAHVAFTSRDAATEAKRALDGTEPVAGVGLLRCQVADPGHGRRKRQRVDAGQSPAAGGDGRRPRSQERPAAIVSHGHEQQGRGKKL